MVFLLFFTPRHHQFPPPLQLLLSHGHQLLPAIRPTALSSIKNTPILVRRIRTKSRRWDSNAETFRTQNFDFDSEDDDFEDDDDDDTIEWLDILEDFIDGVWIFKAFRSFGWLLPAIISSLLLTSGPKAFLMALAIPLGQSVLSFVFQTVWGRPRNRTKSRGKSKRRPPPPPPRRAATSMDIDDEQEDEYVKGERKRTANGYQTWVAGDGGLADEKSNGSSSSSFGGWEELDRRGGSKSNRDRKRKKTSKSTLSRRERRSQTPFLLRLLIAVFPFLGSWTRLL